MHPSVAFRFHTQGYVKKERRLLSDAPFGRFPEVLVRRRPRIRGEIFLSFFSCAFFQKKFISVDLPHSRFWLPCRYTLSDLGKAQYGVSLAMYP